MNTLLLTLMLGAAPDPAESWPGFRGDGTSCTAAKNLPVRWSPTENLAWRTPLRGYGQSSPVVWKDRVFVTAIDGDKKEKLFVIAVDMKDGKVVWTKEFAATQKGKNNPMMSRAAPTPVVDGNGLYVFFESGDLVAISHTGETLWQHALSVDQVELKNNHGLGCSPAQTSETVVLLIDHAGPSFLAAYDKKTGKRTWRTGRMSRSSWTSPIVANIAGREVIVVSSSGTVEVYDATSGVLLAEMAGLTGNGIPSASVANGRILIGAGENRMKPDLEASRKSNCCLNLNLASDKPVLSIAWSSQKVVSHHASPVAYRDHVYFIDKNGIVFCLDLKTGEERYSRRLANQQWATPVAADGHIFFFGKDGVTTVIEAGPSWQLVANNKLWTDESFSKRQEKARKKAKEEQDKSPAAAEVVRPSAGGPPAASRGPGSGRGPGGGPPLPPGELEATRNSAVGDVVYGVAAVDGTFVVRTGTELICVREPSPSKRR